MSENTGVYMLEQNKTPLVGVNNRRAHEALSDSFGSETGMLLSENLPTLCGRSGP